MDKGIRRPQRHNRHLLGSLGRYLAFQFVTLNRRRLKQLKSPQTTLLSRSSGQVTILLETKGYLIQSHRVVHAAIANVDPPKV
jgi:hypothetical protein